MESVRLRIRTSFSLLSHFEEMAPVKRLEMRKDDCLNANVWHLITDASTLTMDIPRSHGNKQYNLAKV